MSRLYLVTAAAGALFAADANAQTVQLPSFHQFAISTTVLVPDRGSVSLGGVRRGSYGSNQFGAPGLRPNRASGAAVDAGGVSVSVRIHDFEAMDKALLEQAAKLRGAAPAVPSVAEINRQKAASAETSVDDAQALMNRAERAHAAGNVGAARVYLQRAARLSTGALREQVLAKYDGLGISKVGVIKPVPTALLTSQTAD